ncbi:class I SAM-dependent methyltransferase [Massilia glaciei]|uniref:Class I SAM-dependent methyltransferase n=1 Tax=Massilia glaciei TaxID=1524097 RepID=A0A2U2HJB6_9BURK|nr:class I SAM-dependent methyltransferase [Massilia glaciei]PWF47648.1 class I SAM-dependent methyltransferase [Massilia glaciei]
MFPITTVLLIVSLLVICMRILHKLRNVHLLLYSSRGQAQTDTAAVFRQFEALIGLYHDLGLSKSLPPTRGWSASPDFLAQLTRHALLEKPLTVVECSSGASTLVLARCMQINGAGRVYSLEHDPVYAEKTRAELARHGLGEFAVVLLAPLRGFSAGAPERLWYARDALPPGLAIDMLAIDGPPKDTGALARYPAGPALFPLLAPNAAVFLDDAARPEEQAILSRWKDEFPALAFSTRECEKGCAVMRANPAMVP